MSEHILKVRLDELLTARVICQHKVGNDGRICGTIVEVPLSSLGNVRECPTCKNELQGEIPENWQLKALAKAMERAAQSGLSRVEFVIPQPTK